MNRSDNTFVAPVAHSSQREEDHAAPTSHEIGETCFGKKLTVVRQKNGMLWEIKMSGGGIMPPELTSLFTRFHDAKYAVESYIATARPT